MKTEKFNVDVQDCWRAAMAHMNAKRNEANKIRADCSQPSHVPSEAEIKTAATGLGGSTYLINNMTHANQLGSILASGSV